jgi:hypothetical protein
MSVQILNRALTKTWVFPGMHRLSNRMLNGGLALVRSVDYQFSLVESVKHLPLLVSIVFGLWSLALCVLINFYHWVLYCQRRTHIFGWLVFVWCSRRTQTWLFLGFWTQRQSYLLFLELLGFQLIFNAGFEFCIDILFDLLNISSLIRRIRVSSVSILSDHEILIIFVIIEIRIIFRF